MAWHLPRLALRVVLDPQGKPLSGANIHSGIWTEEKGFKAPRDYKTDTAGAADVELPKTFSILRLWASKKSFATLFANWEQAELTSGKELPAEYVMRLDSAVTAGGQVVANGIKSLRFLVGQPEDRVVVASVVGRRAFIALVSGRQGAVNACVQFGGKPGFGQPEFGKFGHLLPVREEFASLVPEPVPIQNQSGQGRK